MPSQVDSHKLYDQFRTIQRRPAFSDTAQLLLDEIISAKGRPGVTAGQADAAEKILRDVLEYMRTHDGKMPSQADSHKLYDQFRTIQNRPAVSDTAQSLLDQIRSASLRGVTAEHLVVIKKACQRAWGPHWRQHQPGRAESPETMSDIFEAGVCKRVKTHPSARWSFGGSRPARRGC
jgi:hypothetical protein